MKRYIPPAAIIAALYMLNRFYVIQATTGPLHRLLTWHGADFLEGGLMLCVVNALLALWLWDQYGKPPSA